MSKRKYDKGLRAHLFSHVRCEITDLSSRGMGLCTIELDGKNVVLEIPNAVPGDVVMAELRRVQGSQMQAKLIEKLSAKIRRSPERCEHAKPRIDINTGCGGCSLQGINYADQLMLKQNVLKTAFESVGLGEIEFQPPIGADDEWHYRNKMELSFGPDGSDKLGLGMHPHDFKHEVVNLQQCYLMNEDLAKISHSVQEWAQNLGLEFYAFRKNQGFLRLLSLREAKRTGQCMLILTTSGEERPNTLNGAMDAKDVIALFSKQILALQSELAIKITSLIWTQHIIQKGTRTRYVDHLLWGNPIIEECLYLPDADHALQFEILPRAFFQPNTMAAERLYCLLHDFAAPVLKPSTLILDLYCGTGTIALCFAMHGHAAIGVDIEQQAIQNAKENAEKNHIRNAQFYAGDAAAVLKDLMNKRRFDDYLLIVDPPRRGLLPPSYKQINALKPKHILYVSCNPKSLADDLKKFCNDGYRPLRIQAIDMLPQTAHVECVALLELA
ncbi:MAG: 23S rRNA (uracil(1939)-C(5))-methyltransferase RlmD [Bradymonadales bacterium]